jgi:hypothetical protein
MTTATCVLLAIYISAAAIELLGIRLTVVTYVDYKSSGFGYGTLDVRQPENWWQAARGPVLIAVGVIVGLGGNIVSMFFTR